MDYSQQEMKTRFLETMEKFNFHKWIATEERGNKNNLLHLQIIVWHKDQNINKKACSIKSFRFNKQRLAKKSNKDITQISLAKGKNDSLASYSTKDLEKNDFIITNLTKNEMKLIPKWIDHKDETKVWNKKLSQYLGKIGDETNDLYEPNILDFYCKILQFHRLHKRKRQPTRNTLYNYADQYHSAYGDYDYLRDIGIIKD